MLGIQSTHMMLFSLTSSADIVEWHLSEIASVAELLI
jgi:hypothetical protein